MKTTIKFFFVMALLAFTGHATTYKIVNQELILPFPLVFKAGTAELSPESDSALFHIKNYMNDKTYVSKIRIEGHTDNGGDADNNQLLSEKRALAIGRWLVKNDIDCKRIICVGFGVTKPIESNETPEGKNANRRVSIFNAALRGVPIGGQPIDGGGKVAGDVCNR